MTKKKVVRRKTSPEIGEEFDITWVDIKSVKLWAKNPRFNDEASEKLALIIADNGFRSPIVCWEKTNEIFKGNATYKASKILEKGIKNSKGKIVTLKQLTGGRIPVIFHKFSSRVAANAYGIGDNKGSELADWDEDVLVNMMTTPEFKKQKRNVGFTDTELKMLDFYPPDEEIKTKAAKKGVDLTFKITVEVPQDVYETFLGSLNCLVDEFDGVKIK